MNPFALKESFQDHAFTGDSDPRIPQRLLEKTAANYTYFSSLH